MPIPINGDLFLWEILIVDVFLIIREDRRKEVDRDYRHHKPIFRGPDLLN